MPYKDKEKEKEYHKRYHLEKPPKVIICSECGEKRKQGAYELCTRCYQRQHKRPIIICKNCKKEREHSAFGLCKGCYRKIHLKDYLRKYLQEWRKRNPDKTKKYHIKRKKEQPEKTKKELEEWIKNHHNEVKEFRRKAKSKRRALIKGFLGNDGITKRIQKIVWNESDGYCVHCGKPTNQSLPQYHPNKTTYDHIIEISSLNSNIHKFNPNGVNNLCIACWDCNCIKRKQKPIQEWYKEMRKPIPELIKQKLIKLKGQQKIKI